MGDFMTQRPPGRPMLSTADIDKQAYAEERREFLRAYISFRHGAIASGLEAVNRLYSMYYVLPATRHMQAEPSKSSEFISSLDQLAKAVRDRQAVAKYPDDATLRSMDAVVREFHRIMAACGYS